MFDLLTVTARVVEADGLYRAEVEVRHGERNGSHTTLSQPTPRVELAYGDLDRIVRQELVREVSEALGWQTVERSE